MNMNKKGITLIGMPGAGKSTVGKLLAKKIGYDFLDLDILIKEKEGRGHAEIVKEKGDAELMRLEELHTLGLDLNKTVFSPGGSIVYSAAAMEKLRAETKIIYLELPLSEIKRRLGKSANDRGIVGLAEKGLDGLYGERAPLYEKFAHHTINCRQIPSVEVAEKINAFL